MTHTLILGAKSDIAQAIAYQFARHGHSLTLAAREVDLLDPLAKDITIQHQQPVHLREFDGLDFASHGEFYENLPEKPTVVVCVFGYLGDQKQAEGDFAETQRIINSNYTGAVSIINLVAQDLEQRQNGTIIGISSVAGDRGRQSNYIYGSAKAAFSTYLSGLRNRLVKSGVHVITVKPGYVATRMTANMDLPQPITASPQQVATAIYNAYRSKTNILYTLWMWRWILLIIRSIPEGIFKKLNL
ncbi:SDR family oxidoreductase [Spirulina sp. CS-785/01]|uniref:SDR family oxidoreductase n=1 Tax=Spirulina sp. CS-785/01 TaxID=3021716 RepID=UPI00232E298F|nr:SDR family oxidoreductase [Spirulina sp. CS-785/01]MDB9313760.1 SDR family oxidoreductase [Spirulina sp. CS-785/01]